MVELDVVALPDGTVALGHSPTELGSSVDEAFALVAQSEKTTLLVDVKKPGYESLLVDALRRHGLVKRAVASSGQVEVLEALRRAEPALVRGRTYPHDRFRLGRRRTLVPAAGPTLRAVRAALPRRIGRLLAQADAQVATLQHRVVSRATVERCHARGAAVFAWTVNDRGALERLDRLGVDGIITDDPRVFAAAGATLKA
jgi:glycerophosphoryl diester phosphodiesterase